MKTLSRIVSIAVGILAALGPGMGEAGFNVWTSGGPPGAGVMDEVAIDPLTPTTVYVGGGAGTNRGMFKSINGGTSWTPINNGLSVTGFPLLSIGGLVVNPHNPSILYVGAGPVAGVFKSVDGGASWAPANGPTNLPGELETTSIQEMEIDPQNPEIVYVGGTGGFSKTTNGGLTWARKEVGLPTNKFITALTIDRQIPSTLYVATQLNQVFKSVNGGEIWTPMSNGLGTSSILSLAVDPQNSSIVYAGKSGPGGVSKSTNGGLTWTQTSNTVLFTNVNALAIDPVNPSIVYAGTPSGVFRTTDGGASWVQINQGIGSTFVNDLAIGPSGTCLHAATNPSGVFDFETVPGGCSPLPVAAVLPTSRSVQVNTPATIFATIINPSTITAVGCVIQLNTGVNVEFHFQTTDRSTNALIGTLDTAVNIAPGDFQTFVIILTPKSAFPATDVQFLFICANSAAAGVITGVNTLLLSASDTPVPDMVALVATLTGDGTIHLPGPTGANAFAMATVNVGLAAGSITVTADTGGVALPIVILVCQTNPITGQCLGGGATTSVTTTVNPGETPTFAIFVVGSATVTFDPALNRVFVRLKEGSATRGSTSVAVKTD